MAYRVALYARRARTHTYTHTHTHARMHTRAHSLTHTRTHARTHTHTHTRTHARTHTYAHTHTHTHTHTHMLTNKQTNKQTTNKIPSSFSTLSLRQGTTQQRHIHCFSLSTSNSPLPLLPYGLIAFVKCALLNLDALSGCKLRFPL
jgi:hypothetical protein